MCCEKFFFRRSRHTSGFGPVIAVFRRVTIGRVDDTRRLKDSLLGLPYLGIGLGWSDFLILDGLITVNAQIRSII